HAIAENRFALLKQCEEHIAPEIRRLICGDGVEHARFEHQYAGADPVRKDLIGARLFEETHHAVVIIKLNDAALRRVIPGVQSDGCRTTARNVQTPETVETAIAQVVAVPDEEGRIEHGGDLLDRAGGAEQFRLERISKLDSKAAA